jgi:hypothetical protein
MKETLKEDYFKAMLPEQHDKFAELHEAMAKKKRLPTEIAALKDALFEAQAAAEMKREEEEADKKRKRMEKYKHEAIKKLPPSAKRAKK